MNFPNLLHRTAPKEAVVITKALLRAGDFLAVNGSELAKILGVSEATISRIKSGSKNIDIGKQQEFALLFLRLFRSLDALIGSDIENMKTWLHAENTHLSGKPINLIQTTEGLVDVVRYLDAMRGKL